jgi:hypothetical protein
MFVMNCDVDHAETLKFPKSGRKKKGGKKKQKTEAAGLDEDELYHPVKCTKCSTQGPILRNSISAENFSYNFSFWTILHPKTTYVRIQIFLSIIDNDLGFEDILQP